MSKLPEFIEAAHEFGGRHKSTIKRTIKKNISVEKQNDEDYHDKEHTAIPA